MTIERDTGDLSLSLSLLRAWIITRGGELTSVDRARLTTALMTDKKALRLRNRIDRDSIDILAECQSPARF